MARGRMGRFGCLRRVAGSGLDRRKIACICGVERLFFRAVAARRWNVLHAMGIAGGRLVKRAVVLRRRSNSRGRR